MSRQKNAAAVDILDKVLATISLPHSVDIQALKATIDEQLRVLTVRAPLKQLGKDDSIESRKLALLESILRSSKTSVRLPTNKLASAVGMKTAAFEALSSKVGNYIGVAAQSAAQQQQKRKSSPRTSLSHEIAPSTIPTLSIRLGSQVHDSHGFAQRAEQLLQDMEKYIRSTSTIKSKQEKQGYLIDMQRSKAIYEAVAFYVVAQGRQVKPSRDNEEEEESQLSMQNVVDASAITLSEFRKVLPTVVDFASRITKEQEKSQPARKESGRKRGRPSATSKENLRNGDEVQALLEGVEAAANAETGRARSHGRPDNNEPPEFVYANAFLKWKREVLEKISEETKQNMISELVHETDLSAPDILQRAADEVLQRRGLLDPAK